MARWSPERTPVTTAPAPDVEASPVADPPGRRYLGGVLGGVRQGFVISLLGVGAAVLGLVVQGSAAASTLATEPGQRAACAVGLGDAMDLWCDLVQAGSPEMPEQHKVTPANSGRLCADFVRLGDPQDRSVTTVPCSFLFRDAPAPGSADRGERRMGSLWFDAPASRPQDLDAFATNMRLWAEADDPDVRSWAGKVIARPRDDVLIYALPSPLEHEQSFIVACGTFDLKGTLNTQADVTALAVSLAERWCPATEQAAPGGLED